MDSFSPLTPDVARVRLAFPESIPVEALVTCERLLDDDERTRYHRFRFERDRREFLVSHALLRRALSECAPVPSEAWRFTRNSYGRPEIAPELGVPHLRFNLSHARRLVACVVVQDIDVGIDVEWLERTLDPAQLVRRVFSPEEARCWEFLPPQEKRARFFEIWTLKEAYIKARGMGLSLPLEGFTFNVEEAGQARIAFHPPFRDSPEAWQFAVGAPSEQHRLAVALRRGPRPDLALETKTIVP